MIYKFRAWDAANKQMIYYTWEEMIDAAAATEICNHAITENISDLIRVAEYDYSERMRMQYIGASDMNGNDIYVDDILTDEYNRILLVEWRRYGFCFKAVTETNFVYAYDIMQWFVGDTQIPLIIGNLHETPELLI